ncbi:MAG: hypothetical protein QOG20_1988, partial [Pseudonocardiales bacterium]|nr:hypothetical protein [Pseudonocardiales bacterium]
DAPADAAPTATEDTPAAAEPVDLEQQAPEETAGTAGDRTP